MYFTLSDEKEQPRYFIATDFHAFPVLEAFAAE